jgi:hypothetical protein
MGKVRMSRNQLFIITEEAFRASSHDEVKATVAALREAGLYALPFPMVDVRIAGDCVARYAVEDPPSPSIAEMARRGLLFKNQRGDRWVSNVGPGHWMDFKNVSLEKVCYEKHLVLDNTNVHRLPPQDHAITLQEYGPNFAGSEMERDAVANILIVLLATRNAVKSVEHNSRVRRSLSSASKVGSTRRYEYVTTINVPREMEDDAEHAVTPGQARAPHLRRGHVRRQHHGPRNVMVKSIWVAPVFVNADREWVATRRAYNVSL